MNQEQWRELAQEIHANAKVKGWWGDTPEEYAKERDINQMRLLVASELMEAFEALREGNMVGRNDDRLTFGTDIVRSHYRAYMRAKSSGRHSGKSLDILRSAHESAMKEALIETKLKGCFAIELADAVIRLLNWAAWLDAHVDAYSVMWGNISADSKWDLEDPSTSDLMGQLQSLMNVAISLGWTSYPIEDENDINLELLNKIPELISSVFATANFLEINLHQWIQLKMMYNSVRPHKHGKQF